MFTPQHVIGLDIETDTRVNGLDPAVAAVTSIALAFDHGPLVLSGASEPTLLSRLQRVLADLPPSLISTWNGSGFDLPFLADRAALHGVGGPHLLPQPGLAAKYGPCAGHDVAYTATFGSTDQAAPHTHLDVAYAYRDYAASFGSKPDGRPVLDWSLKPVCQQLGIDMVVIDRTRLHTYSTADVDAYVASDAVGTRELAVRLLSGRLPHAPHPAR